LAPRRTSSARLFGRRRETPRQFDDRLAEENKALGVILVILAVFPVNSRAIEKLVAFHEEELQTTATFAFQKLGHIILLPHSHVHADAGLLRRDSHVIANGLIIGRGDTDFMPALAQRRR
jgi:hypothetical protein